MRVVVEILSVLLVQCVMVRPSRSEETIPRGTSLYQHNSKTDTDFQVAEYAPNEKVDRLNIYSINGDYKAVPAIKNAGMQDSTEPQPLSIKGNQTKVRFDYVPKVILGGERFVPPAPVDNLDDNWQDAQKPPIEPSFHQSIPPPQFTPGISDSGDYNPGYSAPKDVKVIDDNPDDHTASFDPPHDLSEEFNISSSFFPSQTEQQERIVLPHNFNNRGLEPTHGGETPDQYDPEDENNGEISPQDMDGITRPAVQHYADHLDDDANDQPQYPTGPTFPDVPQHMDSIVTNIILDEKNLNNTPVPQIDQHYQDHVEVNSNPSTPTLDDEDHINVQHQLNQPGVGSNPGTEYHASPIGDQQREDLFAGNGIDEPQRDQHYQDHVVVNSNPSTPTLDDEDHIHVQHQINQPGDGSNTGTEYHASPIGNQQREDLSAGNDIDALDQVVPENIHEKFHPLPSVSNDETGVEQSTDSISGYVTESEEIHTADFQPKNGPDPEPETHDSMIDDEPSRSVHYQPKNGPDPETETHTSMIDDEPSRSADYQPKNGPDPETDTHNSKIDDEPSRSADYQPKDGPDPETETHNSMIDDEPSEVHQITPIQGHLPTDVNDINTQHPPEQETFETNERDSPEHQGLPDEDESKEGESATFPPVEEDDESASTVSDPSQSGVSADKYDANDDNKEVESTTSSQEEYSEEEAEIKSSSHQGFVGTRDETTASIEDTDATDGILVQKYSEDISYPPEADLKDPITQPQEHELEREEKEVLTDEIAHEEPLTGEASTVAMSDDQEYTDAMEVKESHTDNLESLFTEESTEEELGDESEQGDNNDKLNSNEDSSRDKGQWETAFKADEEKFIEKSSHGTILPMLMLLFVLLLLLMLCYKMPSYLYSTWISFGAKFARSPMSRRWRKSGYSTIPMGDNSV